MANFRPAGMSEDDSDSDDFGFHDKPARAKYTKPLNVRKKIENNLQEAIINGNLKEVEKLIRCELNNDVNARLDSGWTTLMHACFHAQDKIVEFLMDNGADPNTQVDSVTPIMLSCSNGSANNDIIYSIVLSLVNKNCIINVGDKYGQTPLMRAIGSGRVAVVQKLLEQDINIEMRDQQGWTALFWAVHHNQPEILEMLISKGARLTEIDRAGRTAMNIAISHDYQNIIELLNKELKPEEQDVEADRNAYLSNQTRSWQDYYPGIKKGERPNYKVEIPYLLYGMHCERLVPVLASNGLDLRSFLLLDENDMLSLGIDLPYERQRLKYGLRNFHMRGWKLNSVAGLYARKADNYTMLDCLTTLGTHLQQVYILEATLQFTLREYRRIQNQIKFEPPDSPVFNKLNLTAQSMLANIKVVRLEMGNMKSVLSKICRNNPQPADLIKEKSFGERALGRVTELIVICSIGLIVYQFKHLIKK